MNAFEINKIAGAVLAALLAIFGTRTLINELNHDGPPEKPGYVVEIAEVDATSGTGSTTAAAVVPIATLLGSADAAAGKKLFKKCSACHTNSADGGNRVGPKLYGVHDRKLASVDGFKYSKAMAEKGGAWSDDALDAFLTSPKKYIAGTKMAFKGIKKPEQRANLIKYLQGLK